MNNIFSLEKAFILLMALSGVQGVLFPGHTTRVVMQFSLFLIFLVLILNYFQKIFIRKIDEKFLLIIFLIYGIFIALRSFFYATTYEQWRYLCTVFIPTLVLPIIALISSSPKSFFSIFKSYFIYVLPLSLIYIFHGPDDKLFNQGFLDYMSLIYMALIVFPYCSVFYRVVIVIALVVSIGFDVSNRANVFSMAISLSILCIAWVSLNAKKLVNDVGVNKIFGGFRRIFVFIPIALVLAAFVFGFNVFEYINNYGEEATVVVDSDGRHVLTDSRTGIYIDAYNYLEKDFNWLIGGTAVAMPDTTLAEASDGGTYYDGRLGGSESGILTLATFGGVVYSFLFSLICFKSSHLAIYYSNNILSKCIGVFIAARWAMMFLGGALELNFLWIGHFVAIGVALNPSFRKLSDSDIFLASSKKWLSE